MKVDNSVQTSQLMLETMAGKKEQTRAVSTQTFDPFMAQTKIEEQPASDKMTELMEPIEEMKQLLEEELTAENLGKYKEALRSFLDHYAKNELQMEYYYVRDGRTFMEKKVGIIQSIHEKAENLTENLLETNKGHLETLERIGEIQGLLIDLFV